MKIYAILKYSAIAIAILPSLKYFTHYLLLSLVAKYLLLKLLVLATWRIHNSTRRRNSIDNSHRPGVREHNSSGGSKEERAKAAKRNGPLCNMFTKYHQVGGALVMAIHLSDMILLLFPNY